MSIVLETPATDADPFADEILEHPYRLHDELRALGPAVWLSRYRVFAIARNEDVQRALRDHQVFSSARGVGLVDYANETPWRAPSLLLEADPPEHAVARKVLSGVLSPATVKQMQVAFAAKAARLVDELLEKRHFDGVSDVAARFPVDALGDEVGLPVEGREHLVPYGQMVFNGFGPRNRHFERTVADASAAQEWVAAHTALAGLEPHGLGAQIHAAGNAVGYTSEQCSRLVRAFLSAGIDTTVNAIGSALWCLAERPDDWDALRAEPALARSVFEETVRFESPVQTFFRTTTAPAVVGDLTIPAGTKVLLFLAAANRDPRQFPDPDRFDIRRSTGGHVGFGHGVHACAGRVLARMEGETLLAEMARRIPNLELDGTPGRELNNTTRGFHRLPLKLSR